MSAPTTVLTMTIWVLGFFALIAVALAMVWVTAPRSPEATGRHPHRSANGDPGAAHVAGVVVMAEDVHARRDRWAGRDVVTMAREFDGVRERTGKLLGAVLGTRIDGEGARDIVGLLVETRTGMSAWWVELDEPVTVLPQRFTTTPAAAATIRTALHAAVSDIADTGADREGAVA